MTREGIVNSTHHRVTITMTQKAAGQPWRAVVRASCRNCRVTSSTKGRVPFFEDILAGYADSLIVEAQKHLLAKIGGGKAP